jgi:hypothetical protein
VIGNKNLWPIDENVFLPVNFNFHPIQFTKQSAPETGYLVGTVAAFVNQSRDNSKKPKDYG